MVTRYVIDRIAKEIAGEIVWSSNPAASMKKWREIFKVSQTEMSKIMGIAPSVISDYEKGRRAPGSKFVRKYVETLIEIDRKRGWPVLRSLAKNILLPSTAIIDMREFPRSVPLKLIVKAIEGTVLWGDDLIDKPIYGYTILDSIATIENMTGNEFYNIMGMTTERALVFTNVGTGRSPMVAVRVSPLKPGAVIVHGPREVDPLAIKLAEKDRVPLILSRKESVETLVSSLRFLIDNLIAV